MNDWDASARKDIIGALHSIMISYGNNDASYFGHFAPYATFVFYTHPEILRSTDEYRRLWDRWQKDGWRVLECASSDVQIRMLGSHAVLTHKVQTRIFAEGQEEELEEIETIIFSQIDGRWKAIHEHLGPAAASFSSMSSI